MSDNVYQTPKAQLVEDEPSYPFYVVSIKKFFILYIGTFGLYQIYWFYKNWERQRHYMEKKIWPIARAIFSIFFIHSLFNRIHAGLKEDKLDTKWPIPRAVIATTIVILFLLAQFFDTQLEQMLGEANALMFLIFTVPLEAWLIHFAQKKANLVSGSAEGEANSAITPANILWLILGFGFWLLMLVGLASLYYPDAINDMLEFTG